MDSLTTMRAWATAILALLLSHTSANGQLRPYEPTPWEAFSTDRTVTVEAGVRYLRDQPASLAGVTGNLLEVGLLSATVAIDPVVIRASGAPWRRLRIDRFDGPPAPGTRTPEGDAIAGVGDFSIETLVPLYRSERSLGILRFGTRLPTADNRIGLERDRIDFHALLGGYRRMGRLRASGEAGVGIHGTREAEYEQSDVLIYLAGLEWQGSFAMGAQLVGHADGLPDRSIRGNEELSEVRLFVRGGRDLAARLELIAGLSPYSPSLGFGIWLGAGL